MSKTIITLKNVSKTYMLGEIQIHALQNINFSISKNELISIMGPSGSGKSTLLDIMGLLTRPTSGSVIIEGKNIETMSDDEIATIRRKKVGFVFQVFNLIGRMTALENVMLPMWFNGVPKAERRERAKTLLEEVGLGERIKHKPSQLSGGQRQRVAIARALANNPDIILADEPTGNLDSRSGKEIMDLLKTLHKKENKTIILVTHDAKIEKIAKTRYKLIDGKLSRRR
ncbi:MAG: ABC transporter ATP-binding protein [Candidatus Aenigmarchaeota archaeon]|nr:ABC transporter ATP-binding protein [Candidatus Aenigmarchaeota archaeon]